MGPIGFVSRISRPHESSKKNRLQKTLSFGDCRKIEKWSNQLKNDKKSKCFTGLYWQNLGVEHFRTHVPSAETSYIDQKSGGESEKKK